MYAVDFVKTIETIIKDTHDTLNRFEEENRPMPPTQVFKSRALVCFAAVSELTALTAPSGINISVSMVFEKAKFCQFYCVCGQVMSTEKDFNEHVKMMHLFVFKLFGHLRNSHLPIVGLDFKDIGQRSQLVGTIYD